MIKKIGLHQLKPGMFVHDLNCSTVIHPLFLHRFKVNGEATIDKIAELGVRELYIDTTRGGDVPDSPGLEEVQAQLEGELLGLAGESHYAPAAREPSAEEVAGALETFREANGFVQRVMGEVRLGRQRELDALEEAVGELADTLLSHAPTLGHLSRLKFQDDYTFRHSVGVGVQMAGFCRFLRLGHELSHQAAIGALLHDVGKMRIPLEVLNKPGRLTEAEFDEMKNHVHYGEELLADVAWVPPIARQVLAQHHERYDGSGYPRRLRGEGISQFGQMAAIIDVYDAITSARVYHDPLQPAEAIRKLQEWGKFHFNEELVRHFIRMVGIYPDGTLVRLESGRLGVVVAQNPKNMLLPRVRVVYDSRRGHAVEPYEVDLAAPMGSGGADALVGWESPEAWGIALESYLPSPAEG
ncbi:MAG: HD-GYP domain-containing protein [Sulfuricellaceae bacterium]|jgi:HD-GYP domain-containing protein (c-di-GMP phosphodiesterase class II)